MSPGKTAVVILLAAAFLVGVGILLARAYPDRTAHADRT